LKEGECLASEKMDQIIKEFGRKIVVERAWSFE
jgi:hypothetical protein